MRFKVQKTVTVLFWGREPFVPQVIRVLHYFKSRHETKKFAEQKVLLNDHLCDTDKVQRDSRVKIVASRGSPRTANVINHILM